MANATHRAIGAAIRAARRERGFTLVDVRTLSKGRFKPSLLGAYERGERTISLVRFLELAAIYCVPADVLARSVMAHLHGSPRSIVIDLNALPSVEAKEATAIAEFIHRVRAERGDYLSNVISLRAGDVETLASIVGVRARVLHEALRPAVRRDRALPPRGRDAEP